MTTWAYLDDDDVDDDDDPCVRRLTHGTYLSGGFDTFGHAEKGNNPSEK